MLFRNWPGELSDMDRHLVLTLVILDGSLTNQSLGITHLRHRFHFLVLENEIPLTNIFACM